jgi:peroxiredoxin Q/BCP
VGISADQVDRQREFATENNLGFPLLSDPDRSVARQFGVKRMGPLPTKRATFVIDTDRTVLAVIASETSMTAHADEALDVLRKRSSN